MKKTISLHCTEGGSDKVYHLSLEPSGAGFVVHFAYGRRGSTLQTGTKTNVPVDRADAEKLFGKILSEKTGKGYVITETDASDPAGLTVTAGPGNNAVATSAAPLCLTTPKINGLRPRDFAAAAAACRRESAGVLPQLLNEIDAKAAERLIGDDAYCMQQKHDGHRMMLVRDGAEVYAANKQGLKKAVPAAVAAAARAITIADHFILDGELVGDILHVFDILELRWRSDGRASPFPVIDVRDNSYAERHESLVALLEWADPAIVPVTTAFTTKGKQIALETARSQNWEGVVFKRTRARYTPGRPEHGGDQFKYKFWKSCSAIVSRVNAKRSVAIALLDNSFPATRKAQIHGTTSEAAGVRVNAGNVTIPPNQPIPGAGTVIEIKYLYAFKSSGILYQPIYKGPRDDVDVSECTVNQLQYKGEPC